jgi:hypothetical protein
LTHPEDIALQKCGNIQDTLFEIEIYKRSSSLNAPTEVVLLMTIFTFRAWNDVQIVQAVRHFLFHDAKHQIDQNTLIDINGNHSKDLQEHIHSITVLDHFSPNERVNDIRPKIYQLLDADCTDLDFEVIVRADSDSYAKLLTN